MTNAPDPDNPTIEPSAPPPVDLLPERLAGIESRIAEFQQRSAHREAIIDRLHEENQQLRIGERRVLLEPVIVDLIRLHDALSREASRLNAGEGEVASAALFESFAQEVELILDRCGVEAFSPGQGEPFRPGEHTPLAVLPTSCPEQHNTVAEAVTSGFRDRSTGRIRRPAAARFHQYTEQEH